MILRIIGGALLAYFIGSIATSVWVGRWFFGKDVRQHGSGNAGATNTARVLGARVGIAVLLFDIFKGYLAVSLAILFYDSDISSGQMLQIQAFMGVSAIIGHIFPVYEGFRGGKGVASSLGAALAIVPVACIVAFVVFFLVFLATRYVSLSSVTAAISFPAYTAFFIPGANPELVIFSCVVALILIYTHRSNIKRLIRREEKKFSIGAPSSAGR